MKANYLICYDIADEQRLQRVYRFFKQYGIPIQYSVFYTKVSWQELVNLKNKLRELINEKEDDIRIYPLPSQLKVIVLGCGERLLEGVEIFL